MLHDHIAATNAAGNGNPIDALIEALKSINAISPSAAPAPQVESPEEPVWAFKMRHGIPATEQECAPAIGFSVHWLRKDRRGKQIIPFFMVGSAVRYDIAKALEAVTAFQRGGHHLAPRTRKTNTAK